MISREDYRDVDYRINPYDSFMRKHLQHYGYYTGKNQNYRNQFQQYEEWEKNYAYSLSSSSSSTDSDSDEEEEGKNADTKLQEELLRTTQLTYSYGKSGKMIPHLREPRSLYALNKELGPQQAARWPSDFQVINENIRHIQKAPLESEPFYRATGFETCPMVRGEASGGRTVFCYETQTSFFMKSCVRGSRSGCESCSVTLESADDTTLIFESRFESGNLGKAVQVGENEYELWMRYDLYTNKHTQWFYFRVANTRADKEYRFTIVNYMKPDSLYNDGMRPLLYSEKDAALNKIGWVRGGQDIKYYKNNLRYETGKADRSYYSLTWTIRFKYDQDTVYFSHCYPYTYTDLQDYLLELTNDPIKSRICKQRVLCQTLAGNLVYVLTITSPSQNVEDAKHKKAVVVTSRVHPGESNSSWMMKGFLDFLTGNSPDAKLLRDTFIFKVVPMLNPDGVIVGNYRCSLAGRDLNRNYKTVLKDAYPSVWHTKTMIRKLLQERDIIVYCDLHGHSRRQNVFVYGCEQHHGSNKRFHERVFPFMLSKNTPEKFCFNSCKFKVHKSKESTGRVVMWNLGIMNSYTMEATFCGSSLGKKKGYHFNQNDFEMIGYHFCDTLLDYCDPDNTKFLKIVDDLGYKHRMDVMAKIAQKGLQEDNVDISDIDTESSDGGSDSSASNGPPIHLQFTTAKWSKKKKLKSKKDRDKILAGKEEQSRRQSEQDGKKVKNSKTKLLKPDNVKANGQPVKYTSNTPKRPRSLDDRLNSGIPVYVQERFEEKRQKKKHNYLEALTAAYLRNKIPFISDPGQKDVGAPDRHKQIHRLTLTKADFWSPTFRTVMSQTANTKSGQSQSVLVDIGLHKLTPNWLQETANRLYPTSRAQRGDSAITISRLIGRREIPRSEVPNMEDMLRRSHAHVASFSLLSRRPKPHLLEISSVQQRQTDTLLHEINGPIKVHPNPFDEKPQSGGSHADPPRITSAQTSKKMITALNSIQEMQKLLNTQKDENPTAGGASGNNSAGIYIQELIRETKEEIQDLTNEIQEDIEKKHLQKVKHSSKNSTDSQKDNLNHRQATDGSHQKIMLDIGYHGSTFVNYIDSSKTLENKNNTDEFIGRKRGMKITTSTPDITKTSNQIKSTETSSNTYTSMPLISKKLTTETYLVIGSIETPIEEQARVRNLRKQTNLNTGGYIRNNQHSKTASSPFNNENISGFLQSDESLEPDQFSSPTHSGDKNVNSNIQQLNYSNQNHQGSQNSTRANKIKCSQHNLVFKPAAAGEQANTPAAGSAPYKDNQ